ncbi:MAG: hypothetical protein ACYTFI_01460, partial [Planctomycetota bacterium]
MPDKTAADQLRDALQGLADQPETPSPPLDAPEAADANIYGLMDPATTDVRTDGQKPLGPARNKAPGSIDELKDVLEVRGIDTVNATEADWDAASMKAAVMLKNMSLDVEDVSPEQFDEIRNAWVYLDKSIFAAPRPEERQGSIAGSIKQAMGHMIENVELRLNQASADEQGRVAAPLSEFQVREHSEVLSAAQLMFEMADNESFQTEWMKDVRWAEQQLFRQDRLVGEERVLEDDFHRLVAAYTDSGDPEPVTPSDAPFGGYTIRSLLKWGLDNTPALQEELTYLKSTFTNEVIGQRLAGLGVTEPNASPYQLFVATNPKIVRDLGELRLQKKALGFASTGGGLDPAQRLEMAQRAYLSYAPRVMEETLFLSMFTPRGASSFEIENIGNQNPYKSITTVIGEAGEWIRQDFGELLKPSSKLMRDFYLLQEQKMDQAFNIADRAVQREMELSTQGLDGDKNGMATVPKNRSERLAWLREEDRIGHALGAALMPELGDDAIRLARTYDLPEEFVRQEFLEKGQAVVDQSFMTGYSEEKVGETLQHWANAAPSFLGGTDFSFSEYMRRSWSAAAVMVGGEIRRGVENVLFKPEEAAKDVFAGFAAGGAYESMVAPVLKAPFQRLKDMFAQRRLRRMYAWTATVDADAAVRLRTIANDFVEKGMAPREALDQLNTALHKIARVHERAGRPGADFVKVSGAYQDLQRSLRAFGPVLQDMAKPYGVPGVVRKWHSTPSLRNLVAEGVESIKDVFNSQNRVIPPWIARGSRKILTEIKDAIDEGRTLRPEDLPQGVSSGQLTTGKASARNKMVEWAVNFQSTFAQVASLNSRRRAAQLDFIDYLDTKLSGEIADLEGVNGFLGLDNETVLAVKPIFDTRRALRTIRKDIQGRSWATPTKLTKIPGFTAGRPKDVLHWARTFVDEIELYKTIRESGEDVPATMDRLANLLAAGDETAVTEVAQLVTREFLDAPGVRMRRVVFDPASGEALSPSRVRKIKAERQEYVRSLRSERAAARSRRVSAEQEQAQAILNARMEQTGFGQTNLAQLKTVDTNLPGEWRELLKGVKLERNLDGLPIELEETVARMRARALRAEPGERAKIQKEIGEIERVMDKADEALAEVNIRSMDLHDGSLHTQIKVLENAAKDIRDNMIGVAERNRLLLTRLLKEGPEVRKGFTQALRAQEDVGATWPIEKLRRHAPLRFVGIGNTKDDVIQFLLEESQALREHLLGDMVRSGIINEADRLALIQAYAPSLKGVFELEKLIGGGPKDAKAGFTSLRRPKLDAFELRRHPTQWTATVSLKDGGFSTRHFMNQEGAVRWMADHGVDPNDIPLTAQEWRGKTALGDSARIAGPLGKEIAAALMPIEPGVGLFARMEQLLTDMSFRKFQNMLARTFSDWVIENDAYNKLKANGASQRDLDRYVFVDRARRLGPLSDRWVHTDALNAYRRFTDSHLLMKDLAKEMQELTSSIDLVSRSLRRAGNTLETVGSAANDAIVSNLIVSRPATVANNIMGDMFLYVMPHTPRLLTSLGGWKILGETAWDLVGPLFGKGRYSDEVLLLKRMGVLDDTLADVAQPRTVRAPLLEGILGKDPRHYVRRVFGVSESANPQLSELAKRLDSVEKLIDSESFNRMSPGKQRKILNAAVTMREKLHKRLPKSMMGTVRRQLVDLFQRLSLGRPGGSFDEVTRVGRELYGALNNVLRVAVYRYRTRTLGESPEEAMHVVRHAMQTYSRAPTFTRRLARSVPGSPVIS